MHLNVFEGRRPGLGTALPRQCGTVGLAGLYHGGQPTAFSHGIVPCVCFDYRNNDRPMRQVFVIGIGNNQGASDRFAKI